MGGFSELLSLVIAGLASGSAYALLALGVVIIFRSTDAVNFAIGQTGVIALYVAGLLLAAGAPLWLVLVAAILVGALLGVVTDRAIIRPLGHRKNFAFISLVITIGLTYMMQALIGAVWGHPPRAFPPPTRKMPLAMN